MACTSFSIFPIGGSCEASKGGIKRLFMAQYARNVYSMTTFSGTGIDLNEVVTGTTTGSTWEEFVFNEETGNFTSTYTIDRANGVNFCQTDINLVFTKGEASKRKSIAALALTDTIAVVEDANGTLWAFGTEAPVVVSAAGMETGTAATDGNKMTLTLVDKASSYPVPFTADAAETFLGQFD